MSDDFGAPPAVNLWDPEVVVAGALAVLRLGPSDVDESRVREAADEVIGRVDREVDWLDASLPTPNMVAVAVRSTVRAYRLKDATLGTADSWSADAARLDVVSGDVLAGEYDNLLADKQRFGVA